MAAPNTDAKMALQQPRSSTGRGFLHNLMIRLMAMGLWKAGVVVLALALGTGVAYGWHQFSEPRSPGPGVVLRKLVALRDFHAAQGQYAFDFTDVLHKGFLFLTGESIHVVGSGTDDAIVNFASLSTDDVREGPSSVSLWLPSPYLGTPAVDLGHTTLIEKGGVLTHLVNLFRSDPNSARAALQEAQNKIGMAAAHSPLISRAETSTRTFLTEFLRRLGFTKVAVNFW